LCAFVKQVFQITNERSLQLKSVHSHTVSSPNDKSWHRSTDELGLARDRSKIHAKNGGRDVYTALL